MNAVAPASERIRAYLDGTLSESEREDFELALFDDPDLAEAVDAERLLRIGLRELHARSTAPRVMPVPRRSAAARWLPLAASLAVGVLLGALVTARYATVAPTAVTGGKVHHASLSLSRNAPSNDLVLELPADASHLVLQFTRPQPADVASYTVELERPDGSREAYAGLTPAADTQLSLGLVAANLPDGRYTARLVAIGHDGSRRDDQERRFLLRRVPPKTASG